MEETKTEEITELSIEQKLLVIAEAIDEINHRLDDLNRLFKHQHGRDGGVLLPVDN